MSSQLTGTASARAVLLPPAVGIDLEALNLARRLRAIGRIVGGPDNLDLAACAQAGVEVVRSTDAAAPAEAEFMLGALLGMAGPLLAACGNSTSVPESTGAAGAV